MKSTGFALLIFLLLFVLTFSLTLSMNSGHFVYTLDDPYIHLRLAENIAQGHYGINASEYTAPSSSILWPLLLVPFSQSAIGEYIPLILNILASLGTLTMMGFIFTKVVQSERAVGVIVTLLIPGLNLIALTFTGMEHTLHVFLTTLVVAGLIVELETGLVPWWLVFGIILGPLIRYEALPLTLTTVCYLLYRRQVVASLVCGVFPVVIVGSFSWYLRSLGLEWLPNSIIAKSSVISTGGSLPAFLTTLGGNLLTRQGAVLVGGMFLLGVLIFNGDKPHKERMLAGWMCIILLSHLLFVPVGGNRFYRYDIYIFAATFVTLFYLYRDFLADLVASNSKWALNALAVICLVGIAFPFFGQSFFTPLASNNIYEQQYQMQAFAQHHYRHPVAVNDLGLVSYGANQYVLDLWGLGSLEALRLRREAQSGEWMTRLAQKHQVHLAMIYDRWFPHIPEDWFRLATLNLGKVRISPADSTVSFYVVDQTSLPNIRAALESFQKSLPQGVTLQFPLRNEL